MRFRLTNLEKAALLKKAGITNSLLQAVEQDLLSSVRELDGVYDPIESPEFEGESGYARVFRAELSGKKFVLLQKAWIEQEDLDPKWQSYLYLFLSEGEELDASRLSREKLEKLLKSAERHLPEALDILREEYASIERAT
jgi:hypothetical protein